MNKKGFTLIELLCVIVLIALIATIASSGIMTLSKKSKENLYCAKIKLIETAAKDYGTSHELELNNSVEYYQGYQSIKITIQDLIASGLLDPDDEQNVVNPIDNSTLNNEEIILYLKNNQIEVYIDTNNVC